MKRCPWARPSNKKYVDYHDLEWGVPVFEDPKHFEMLVLEGAQAGLSWETILKKRSGYREAFYDFDVQKVADMKDTHLEELLGNPGLVRHRLKIFSVRQNAQIFLGIQKEFKTFNDYVWAFAPTTKKAPQNINEIPTSTKESQTLSKDLKKRGMNFVGPTIMYAYMQAVGIVNDHLEECFRSKTL
jgi:DNA-3-methyladenine glycosylase I